MIKLVWDSSALINLKEPDKSGYSPAYSLWKDLADGWINLPYQNIIPTISMFEVNAGVSRKKRESRNILREFYLFGEHEVLYPIDDKLVAKSSKYVGLEGFNKLKGADLIFACIAKVEDAWLVTTDNDFKVVGDQITVVNLNESRASIQYASYFETYGASRRNDEK